MPVLTEPATPSETPAPPTRAPALGRPASIDRETRTLSVTLSTATRDRQGDIVASEGLDFANYLKNPVVLWAHDLTAPPVGRVLDLEVTPTTVTATVQFAETEFAREVFELYAGGFLNAWSIGFIPRRWERLAAEDGDNRTGGFHVLEAEVVEVSAVPVPANPETLTRELPRLKSHALRSRLTDAITAAKTGQQALPFADGDWQKSRPEPGTTVVEARKSGGEVVKERRKKRLRPPVNDNAIIAAAAKDKAGIATALTRKQLTTLALKLADQLAPAVARQALARARGIL